MRVYKFIPRQYGLEAIANRRLKVSEILKANDVYEYGALVIESPEWFEGFREIQEASKAQIVKTVGILSFCEKNSDPVVWGHYAECNRGLCLGFEIAEKKAANGPTMSNIEKVRYIRDPILFPLQSEPPADDQMMKTWASFVASSIRVGLFSKYEGWAHEDEWRIIAPFEIKIGDFYFVSFGNHFVLKEVILGCRNPDSKADINSLLNRHGYKDVDVWKVKPVRTPFNMVRDKAFDEFQPEMNPPTDA